MADTDPRITKARKILREGMTRGTKALEGSTNRATGTRALYQEGHRAAVEALRELGGKVPEGAEVRSRGGQPGAKRTPKASSDSKKSAPAKKSASEKRADAKVAKQPTKPKASASKARQSKSKASKAPKDKVAASGRPDIGVPLDGAKKNAGTKKDKGAQR